MLKSATLHEIKNGTLTKGSGCLIVATRFYPRFLKRDAFHDYISELSPSRELMRDFKSAIKHWKDHNEAFNAIDYERRFEITNSGFYELKWLSALSREKDVFLSCYCQRDQYCHRDLLLILAEQIYHAPIEKVIHPYEKFHDRVQTLVSPVSQVSAAGAVFLKHDIKYVEK